jgi:hypothetical protein
VATAGACAAGITRISHFDVYQLCWRPNFDRFFFDQKRSINNFLFRGEFIFELGRTVIGEVPQLGHATYVFTRPADIREFVRRYATTTREERHDDERLDDRTQGTRAKWVGNEVFHQCGDHRLL